VFCRRMKRARDTQGEPERARKAYAEDRRLTQEARLKTPAQIERTAEQTEARQNRDERRLKTSAVKARVDEAMKYSGHWDGSYTKRVRKVLTSVLQEERSLAPALALDRAKQLIEERAEDSRIRFGWSSNGRSVETIHTMPEGSVGTTLIGTLVADCQCAHHRHFHR
jgi:hypothetical protein